MGPFKSSVEQVGVPLRNTAPLEPSAVTFYRYLRLVLDALGMLQLNDSIYPESPGAAVLHPADCDDGLDLARAGASVACCTPLQTLTPFHVHNPTMRAKVKDYFVFRVRK